MSHGTRASGTVVVLMLVVLMLGVPLSLYEQNQNGIHRNSDLIARVAKDEAATKQLVARLATDETATKNLALAQTQSLCLSGNDYRMQDAELWHFIFNAFPNPNPTPEERRRTAQFLAFLAVHDKQRDCSKL